MERTATSGKVADAGTCPWWHSRVVDVELAQAVRNNACWCDHVCREQGIQTAWLPSAWIARRRTPPFYPDAVTLVREVDPETVLAAVDAGPGCSIKDSFADLDLLPYGFRVLFEAEWIYQSALVRHSEHQRSEEGARLSIAGGSVIANRSDAVVALSNLVVAAGAAEQGWRDAVRAVGEAYPGRDLVGYERAEDLPAARSAGFRTIGPLRIWIKDGSTSIDPS